MKITITQQYELDVPDGSTHYRGRLFAGPVEYLKRRELGEKPRWYRWSKDMGVWEFQAKMGDNEPKVFVLPFI